SSYDLAPTLRGNTRSTYLNTLNIRQNINLKIYFYKYFIPSLFNLPFSIIQRPFFNQRQIYCLSKTLIIQSRFYVILWDLPPYTFLFICSIIFSPGGETLIAYVSNQIP